MGRLPLSASIRVHPRFKSAIRNPRSAIAGPPFVPPASDFISLAIRDAV
jgi:hypothetical protein